MKTPLRPSRAGFSLVELLVSMTLLAVLLTLVFQMLSSTQRSWKSARQVVTEYKDARVAFEAITRRLSQATLNTYWAMDYGTNKNSRIPNGFIPESDLHFVSGPVDKLISKPGARVTHSVFFHAPLGYTQEPEKYDKMNGLLTAIGYYVEFSSDLGTRPPFIDPATVPARYRFRLMEFRQPAEGIQFCSLLSKLRSGTGTKPPQADLYKWFDNPQTYGVNFADNYKAPFSPSNLPNAHPVAENIIALILLPTESQKEATITQATLLAPNYLYDSREYQWKGGTLAQNSTTAKSRHQIPPLMDVTMIAVEESSMVRYMHEKQITNANKAPELISKSLFTNPLNYQRDLDSAITELTKAKIGHRVFRTTVRMRESKWGDANNYLQK
jgi:uncharacterized protein (TIGR02599 family)